MRTHLALAVLALAGALVLPTAAVPFTSSDQVHGELELAPHAGPNGDYAVVNTDDEIALRFDASNPTVEGEGVNAGTATPFHRVFNVTYTGERYAEVWLTTEIEGVDFYRADDPDDSVEGRENEVTLGPGETLQVGVLVDATEDVSGDQFTVHARLAESEDVGGASGSGGSDTTGASGGPAVSGDSPDDEATSTPTPSPTPTTTATPSTTSTATPSPTATATEGDDGGTSAAGGATPTPTADGDTATTTTEAPQSLGGFDPFTLALVAAAIALALAALGLSRSSL